MDTLPAHLQNRQGKRQVAQEARTGLGSATPPSVSIKGGAFTLVDANGDQIQIATNYLDCIIIDANPAGVQRVFWGLENGQPKQFDDSGLPPKCFSDNGIGASVAATEPQSASCASCPMKQFNWPSKIDPTKRTSACRPIKKVAVLAYVHGEKDNDGVYHGAEAAEFPFLLRVPVTSHDNLKSYSSRFTNQPFDVSDVVTRIKFVHGAVGQIEFDAHAYIDSETDAHVDKILESKVTDDLVGKNDRPIQGQLPAPATAAVIEAPKPAPQQAAVAPWQDAPAVPAKAGRGRPRKQPLPEQSAPFAAPQQAAVAPFAQRPGGIGSDAQPNHGIVQNAPAPSADMEKTLDSIFALK